MIDLTSKSSRPRSGEAEAHSSRVDPRLATTIQRNRPRTPSPRRDYFGALCQSIINQQISTKAALSVWRKFRGLCPGRRPAPAALLAMADETLRSAGLSRQKASYLRSLAEHFASGAFPVRRL